LLCAGAAAQQTPPPQTPPTPTFRASTRTVAVYATVQDRTGRLVPDLTKDEFQVLDNGRPTEIVTFSNEVLPVTVVLMLDMSSSMREEFLRVRDATRHFIDALGPGDRVRLGTFGWEVAVSPHLTGDKGLLHRILDEEVWHGGGTPLWTAMKAGMQSLRGEPGRRVVLTLTDGQNVCGFVPEIVARPATTIETLDAARDPALSACASLGEIETLALDGEFILYAIGMEGAGLETAMMRLAEESGGGHISLRRNADLTSTLAQVVDELHHQYALGFRAPQLDGAVHTLEVRLNRSGLTARARRSYLATDR
jgi:Ca-activated chloride channel family protein